MRSDKKGFTLVELLIVMLISSLVVTAIYSTYVSQQRTHDSQQRVVETQQNLRAGMDLLEREIRMAGYDLSGFSQATIEDAAPDLIAFSRDLDGDGLLNSANEHIVFDNYVTNNIPSLGMTSNNAVNTISPDVGTGHFESANLPAPVQQPAAYYVEALGFAYAFDSDGDNLLDQAGGNTIWAVDWNDDGLLDRNLDTNNDGLIDTNDAQGGAALGTTVTLDKIRAVRIWMLVRASFPTENYQDTRTYVVGYQWVVPPAGDGYERRLLTAVVECRNMGLK